MVKLAKSDDVNQFMRHDVKHKGFQLNAILAVHHNVQNAMILKTNRIKVVEKWIGRNFMGLQTIFNEMRKSVVDNFVIL
ncbi:MAG: hypothetical protein JRG73_17645 [Deltaproteobacteria bacterium]|nr:hypothetical protein [Deltaproteobacteria bacterium]MBW2308751.1 hypothetical protein [Deltaproteobacteria bacterium]